MLVIAFVTMAGSTHLFQAPKGMRDFFPEEMAIRRHIERAWRSAATCHGFDEIDGPTFEHLDLYTVKSGDGIVNELFSFRRAGGETDYALRPEFTPTLARMAASLGRSLPLPTKWFAIPDLFRAERPQRGRLREHRQWNVDLLGAGGPDADAEVIAIAVTALRGLGLTPEDVRVRISHRGAAIALLEACGVAETHHEAALNLIDRREKIPREVFAEKAADLGLDETGVARLDDIAATRMPASEPAAQVAERHGVSPDALADLDPLAEELARRGLLPWCDWDLGIVRGLAYYTGPVWEIHDANGEFRAIAGGGRYDELVSLFGGPSVPACGFGMGDVVLTLLLQARGLLEDDMAAPPRPDVFLITGGSDVAEQQFIPLATSLRDLGLHVRHTWKSGRNIGKQLKEAVANRSRFACILGDEMDRSEVAVKDLDAGTQCDVPLADLPAWLHRGLAGHRPEAGRCDS